MNLIQRHLVVKGFKLLQCMEFTDNSLGGAASGLPGGKHTGMCESEDRRPLVVDCVEVRSESCRLEAMVAPSCVSSSSSVTEEDVASSLALADTFGVPSRPVVTPSLASTTSSASFLRESKVNAAESWGPVRCFFVTISIELSGSISIGLSVMILLHMFTWESR